MIYEVEYKKIITGKMIIEAENLNELKSKFKNGEYVEEWEEDSEVEMVDFNEE